MYIIENFAEAYITLLYVKDYIKFSSTFSIDNKRAKHCDKYQLDQVG